MCPISLSLSLALAQKWKSEQKKVQRQERKRTPTMGGRENGQRWQQLVGVYKDIG
jgi:hypothetical protein